MVRHLAIRLRERGTDPGWFWVRMPLEPRQVWASRTDTKRMETTEGLMIWLLLVGLFLAGALVGRGIL